MKAEGPLALYKGMGGPLLTVPLLNAIVFATYEQGLALFRRHELSKLQREHRGTGQPPTMEDVELSLGQYGAAGAWAGLVNTAIVGPVELIKSRLQIQFERVGAKAQYSGPWHFMRDVIQKRGIRGLFMGGGITVTRELPAYGAQFYCYEALKRFFAPPGETTADLGPVPLMLSGAAAGMMAWVASYPQDVIKSRIQIQPHDQPRRYPIHPVLRFDGGAVACARSIWKEKRWRGFFIGFGPCVARALPANAVGFLTYEFVLQHWNTRMESQR
jgi:solute carrier family 25 carnitine/acylcarnitine transporter 20/29